MRNILIIFGLALLLIGLLWPILVKLPLGRLPGDITIQGENYVFKFPIVTCLLLSALLTLVLYLVRKIGL